jgi:phosphoribosyl-dephospho-CoA transferase
VPGPTDVAPALRVQRQQLVWLTPEGWAQALAAPWDDSLRPCLAHWAGHGLPLVVTRQRQGAEDGIATGLPAPARWHRRRLSLAVAPRHVLFGAEFPPADALIRHLPGAASATWRALLASLAALDCRPRVYGGYGWQVLTGLAYVHAQSDIDLLLPVTSAPQADAVVRHLSAVAWVGPRLDGELLFPDGAAIAWREWAAWRHGQATQVLVKRLHGVALETPPAEFA